MFALITALFAGSEAGRRPELEVRRATSGRPCEDHGAEGKPYCHLWPLLLLGGWFQSEHSRRCNTRKSESFLGQ